MITIVSITSTGDQLTASGYQNAEQLVKHLRERLDSPTAYVRFVVVSTDDEVGTQVKNWDRMGAEAYIIAMNMFR